jgi:heptosyltransferase I
MYTAAKQARSGIRILVVRLGSMGDLIHALPAVATLKHSFPGSRLTWMVEARWAELLEGNVFVDRVVVLERKNLGGIWRALRELRSERYDLAVDFQGLIKSALAASLARPDRIYGFHQSQLREKAAGLFYSGKTLSQAGHVVDQNLDLAGSAGATSILRAFPLPEGRPEGETPQGDFVLASPLAGWAGKQWPFEYYEELAARLRMEIGLPLVVNGPVQDAARLAGIRGVLVHCSSLSGLIEITRRATAVVGIDSGPLHLAAALGKPGVAVYGPTDPGRNGPYGCSFTVLRSPRATTTYKRSAAVDRSMFEISSQSVFEALKLRLNRSASAGCCA